MGYEALLLGAVLYLAGFVFVGLTHYPARPYLKPVYQIYLGAVTLAYFAGFWTHGGQTPAMRAWRLKLEAQGGGPVPLGRAALRFACAVGGLVLGGATLWWSLLDREGLFLHDRLAATRLVRLAPPSPGRP